MQESDDQKPTEILTNSSAGKSETIMTPKLQEQYDFQLLKLPIGSDDRGLNSVETNVTRAGAELVYANRLINALPSDQQAVWRAYQITLVEQKDNPESCADLLARRNALFPDIANYVKRAEGHLGANSSLPKLLPQLELVNDKPVMGLLAPDRRNAHGPSMDKMLSAFSNRSPHKPIDTEIKSAAVEALRKINNPGHAEAASLRAARYCDFLTKLIPAEVTRPDSEAVLRNPMADAESKDLFFQSLERLLRHDPNAPAGAEERAIVSLQFLRQAGQVESVDQGDFKTCALGSVEKRLLMRDPGLLARMVADVAMTGTTKTDTGRTVSLEKEWMTAQSAESTNFPPVENARTLASQYVALVLGNVKFQLNNEQDGTNYRFAHVRGNDVVLDYATNPPSPLFRSLITNEIDTDPIHRFDDGKVMVGPTWQPLKKPIDHSPHANEKDIIDTYAAVTGKSGDNLVLMHYAQARGAAEETLEGLVQFATLSIKPRDHRVAVYRTEGEMQEHLKRAKETNNLPLIFLSPNHAATISGYYPESQRADYDNQWGKSMDFLGKNAMSTKELFTLGARIEPQELKPGQVPITTERVMSVVKEARKQYEAWCTASGVAPDTRYPTMDEYLKWTGKYQRPSTGVK